MFFSANIISIFLTSWLHESVGGWVKTAYVKASTKQENSNIPQRNLRYCIDFVLACFEVHVVAD